jgi:mono/diheme cytochrome c family protein
LTGKRSVALLAAGLALAGCRQDMHDAPRIEPLEANAFFADGMGARPIPAGTVARGMLTEDPHTFTGRDADGELVDALPAAIELDRALLVYGRERFEIYCSPCHDSTGGGRGMIVRRGFKQPPPLWEARLRQMPLGHFFDVVTRGFGVMSSYARQVPVDDRWAIVAYVRVLQASQATPYDSLSGAEAEALRQGLAATAAQTHEEGGH